jgi:hypothetical protein
MSIVIASLEINSLISLYKAYLKRQGLPIKIPTVILEVFGSSDTSFLMGRKFSPGWQHSSLAEPLPRFSLMREDEYTRRSNDKPSVEVWKVNDFLFCR